MKFLKKIFVVSACAGICCLSMISCGKSEEKAVKPVEIGQNITFRAQISQEKNKYDAKFKRNGETWECTFNSPESIKGMKVTLSGDVCKIDFNNLNYQLERKNLPEASFVSLITKSVDKLVLKKDLSCRKTSDSKKITETGNVSGTEFSAEINNGKISSVNFGENLSVKIS